MAQTVYALPRLVPDPLPYVPGKGRVPRMLTKREYAALLPVLEAAEGDRGHRYDPSNEDEWTAFGSLLAKIAEYLARYIGEVASSTAPNFTHE